MTCTISLMTIYAHCRRKGKRADQVQVQVGANQVNMQARKDQMFPSWTTSQTIDPTPQGVIRECSLSGAAAKFGRRKEVGV
jgi:hypothetical protein